MRSPISESALPPSPAPRPDLVNLDIAKFLCALLVICIHASPFADSSELTQFYAVQVIARIAVPLFYAMSGFLFFGRLEYESGRIKRCAPNQTRLLRYIGRTGLLYIGWSAAYLLAVSIPMWYRSGWWGLHVVKDYLVSLVFKGGHYHLWYLLALIYAVPVLYGLLSVLDMRKAAWIAVPLWICECLTYSYSWVGIDRIAAVTMIGSKMPILFDTFFRAVPLLLLGAVQAREHAAVPSSGRKFLLSLLLCICEASVLYFFTPNEAYFSYLFSTPLAAYSGLRFLLSCKPLRVSHKAAALLRRSSTIIYVLHPMVIDLAPGIPEGPVRWAFVTLTSTALSICFILAQQALKNPRFSTKS